MMQALSKSTKGWGCSSVEHMCGMHGVLGLVSSRCPAATEFQITHDTFLV